VPEFDNTQLAFAPAIQVARTTGTLVRGVISILHFTHDGRPVDDGSGLTQEEALRDKLAGRTRVKIATDKKDDTRVLKVTDAIKCIEEFLNGDVVRDILMAVLKGQVTDSLGPINSAFDVFAVSMTACIRGKALRQNIERISVTVSQGRKPGRPKGGGGGGTSYGSRRRGAPGAG